MRTFIVTSILIIALAGFAFSDIIYFKDGGKVEGIVKEEAEDHVIIDMGFGTMSIRKDEIDHIQEATEEELERLKKKKFGYEIESGEWAPAGYEYIRMLYRKAKDNKNTLQAARRKGKAIRAEISQKEKRLSALLDTLDKKGKKLKTINAKKNVKKYNEIVANMNSLNADLNKTSNDIKDLYEDEKKLNAKLSKLANEYRSNFQLFKEVLSQKRDDIDKVEVTVDESYFFETMDNKAREMEGDFRRDVALYTPEGSHVIVDALIGENVSARLIVDTGASIVVISNDVASRLGIKSEDIHTGIDIIMADGSSVQAKPIILKSVKVGNAEVKNVQAAILSNGTMSGVDGLLGMSFLSHFVISVDSAGKKLILERVL